VVNPQPGSPKPPNSRLDACTSPSACPQLCSGRSLAWLCGNARIGRFHGARLSQAAAFQLCVSNHLPCFHHLLLPLAAAEQRPLACTAAGTCWCSRVAPTRLPEQPRATVERLGWAASLRGGGASPRPGHLPSGPAEQPRTARAAAAAPRSCTPHILRPPLQVEVIWWWILLWCVALLVLKQGANEGPDRRF